MSTRAATGAVEPPFWGYWRAGLNGIATVLVAGVAGASLIAVVWRFGVVGPLLMIGLAAIPLVTVAVFKDPRMAAALLFLTFPLSTTLPPLDPFPLQLVEATLIVVATIVVLVRLALGRAPLGWASSLWWVLAIVALALLALPSAADRTLGINQTASIMAGLLLMSVILAVTARPKDARVVLGIFALVASITAVIGAMTAGTPSARFGGAVIADRPTGSFAQPNELGSFSALGMFVALAFALGGRTLSTRIAGWLGGAACMIGMLLSLSRGAWVGTGLAAMYLFATLPEARRAVAAALVPFAVGVFLFGSFAPSSPQVAVVGNRLAALTAENPYDSRPQIWMEARNQIEADPWTGQGPGSFPTVSARSSSEAATVQALHAHNVLLNWGAEMGLPAALMLVGLAVSLGLVARRAGRVASQAGDRRQRAFIGGIVAALITVMGQGLFDYVWRNQVIFFAIVSVTAGLIALSTRTIEAAGDYG